MHSPLCATGALPPRCPSPSPKPRAPYRPARKLPWLCLMCARSSSQHSCIFLANLVRGSEQQVRGHPEPDLLRTTPLSRVNATEIDVAFGFLARKPSMGEEG